MKAFTQLKSFEGRGSMEGWLTRIATNTCLNLIRSAKRRPESTVSDLTDDENKWLDARLSDVASEPRHSVEQTLIAADLADRCIRCLVS